MFWPSSLPKVEPSFSPLHWGEDLVTHFFLQQGGRCDRVWPLKLGNKRHCCFYLVFLNRFPWERPAVMSWGHASSSGKGPRGERLRPPTHGRVTGILEVAPPAPVKPSDGPSSWPQANERPCIGTAQPSCPSIPDLQKLWKMCQRLF